MSKKREIVFVSAESGDWVGMYVDGVLVAEDHSLHRTRVVAALGLEHRSVEVEDEWLEENGARLPRYLEKVKAKK